MPFIFTVCSITLMGIHSAFVVNFLTTMMWFIILVFACFCTLTDYPCFQLSSLVVSCIISINFIYNTSSFSDLRYCFTVSSKFCLSGADFKLWFQRFPYQPTFLGVCKWQWWEWLFRWEEGNDLKTDHACLNMKWFCICGEFNF
jgi:hypothetical protein